jgi:hypothetical protein
MGAIRIFCQSGAAEIRSKFEGFEGDVLGGDEQFAGEGGFGGTAAEGFFGGEADEIGIVVLLGDVGEDEVADTGIEAFGIGEEFADGVIGEVAGAGEDALLDNPGIGSDLEHIEVVIGFEDEAIGLAEVDSYMIREVTEIGADGDFGAVGAEGESDGVGGVMRDCECVNVDIADRETLARLDGLDATEALAEGVGQDALERLHGGFCDVERCFPESEDLREAVAVVGVFVGDKDRVETIDVALYGGEAGEGFSLSESGVNEDTDAFCFEQG